MRREDFIFVFKPTEVTANLTILCYGGMLDEVLMAMSELLKKHITYYLSTGNPILTCIYPIIGEYPYDKALIYY